ncbi:D-isomer specific 2-hydroxyacid dehydrogenase [Trichoderma chlorosporum]
MHHKIVALDAWHVPIPQNIFNLPPEDSYELKVCETQLTSNHDIQEAVKDATIIAVTLTRLDASTLSAAATPNLRLVAAIASGTDGIDKQQCKERGIMVLNSPDANTESVSNHVLAMYFACRRRLLMMQKTVLATDAWVRRGTIATLMNSRNNELPLSCKDETVGVIGYGAIGRRVAHLCRGLGMNVLIASRKGAVPAAVSTVQKQETVGTEAQISRTPFAEVLRRSSVLVLCIPRIPETLNLISHDEFQMMSGRTILINVSRGGIVDEIALLQALKGGAIDGCATDVFLKEPSGAGDYWKEGDSPILKVSQAEAEEMNLLVTPHVAWYARATVDGYLQTFKQNVEDWCAGKAKNIVV